MEGELFDPQREVLIEERLRPHWSQAGAIVFVSFRTKDSIPKHVLEQWDAAKYDWLDSRGWETEGFHWSQVVRSLPDEAQHAFQDAFQRVKEDCLDQCLGRCLLKRPEIAAIVAQTLKHFHGQRYALGDFIIMPNHVHLLAAFPNPSFMRRQIASWLRFSATRIHRMIGERGHFWQQEPFDHLVRSNQQYEYLRRYIADNPLKAGLRIGEYLYERR